MVSGSRYWSHTLADPLSRLFKFRGLGNELVSVWNTSLATLLGSLIFLILVFSPSCARPEIQRLEVGAGQIDLQHVCGVVCGTLPDINASWAANKSDQCEQSTQLPLL